MYHKDSRPAPYSCFCSYLELFLWPGNQECGGKNVSRIKGKVKWFGNIRGFGFIGRENGPDVFVHYTGINAKGYRSLEENDDVEFEIVEGPTGRPQASEVTKVLSGVPETVMANDNTPAE